jgi:hypothetical protein
MSTLIETTVIILAYLGGASTALMVVILAESFKKAKNELNK